MKRRRAWSRIGLQALAVSALFVVAPQISLAASTFIIADEVDGRDCISVGLWDEASKTCTLSRDVPGFIEIANDGITLDGAGYSVGALGNAAISIPGRFDIVIKGVVTTESALGIQAANGGALVIRENTFNTQGGIAFNNVSDSRIDGNQFNAPLGGGTRAISLGREGVAPDSSRNARNIVIDSDIRGAYLNGIYIDRAFESEVKRNTIADTRDAGMVVSESDLMHVEDNTLTNTAYGFHFTPFTSTDPALDSVFLNNTANERMFAVLIDASSFPDLGTTTFSGIVCLRCHDFAIEGLTFVASGLGLMFADSSNITAQSNSFQNVSSAVGSLRSQDVSVRHNDFDGFASALHTHNGAGDIRFWESLPIGGNHYSNFDESNEGCTDADADFICEEDLKHQTGYWDEAPWLDTTHWGATEPPTEECCSSVVFLPGIKGSRLIKTEFGLDDELWPPSPLSNDGRELAMDQNGNSITNPIYTPGLFYRVRDYDLYDSFKTYAEELVVNDTISGAAFFPYDWRYDVYDIVNNPVLGENGANYDMAAELRRIASSSQTGKVIIIGHSNGGLVGKALIESLGENAKDLIEQFVMVGTPQLGTPQAIAAMLHATRQDLYYGPIKFLSGSDARFSSRNMLGALTLLPMGEYFNIASVAPIEFMNHPVTQDFRTAYGQTIATDAELRDFLVSNGDSRNEPDETALNEPIILNQALVAQAIEARRRLENWHAPTEIIVTEFAGTGLPTIETIQYGTSTKGCSESISVCISPNPLFSTKGDETVMANSAAIQSNQGYTIDLAKLNAANDTTWEHGALMAIPELHAMLTGLITHSSPSLPLYFHTGNVTLSSTSFQIVKTFSPVTIEAVDSEGRELKVTTTSGNELLSEIPNGVYGSVGDMQYIALPIATEAHFSIKGTGTGTLDLIIEQITETGTETVRSHQNIPVNKTLNITFENDAIASDISVDVNGDGKVDELLWSPRSVTVQQIIREISSYVSKASINKVTKTAWQLRITLIQGLIKVGKKDTARLAIKDFESAIEINYRLKVISQEVRVKMIRYLAELKYIII